MSAQAATVLVAGAGSWGTALAILLARNGQQTWLWGHHPQHLAEIEKARQNARYLPGIPLPDNLHLTTDLAGSLRQVNDLMVVVPSHAFAEVLTLARPGFSSCTRLSWATKGLEPGTGRLLHQVARELLGDSAPIAVISGPTFAGEVARGLPTAVTVAGSDLTYAEDLAGMLRNPAFRVYTCTDLTGVEIGAASKNVIAIAAGIADGLGFGANTRAALVTRGLVEIMRLGLALGGKAETFMGLSGLGDLMLTCTDNQSRNRRFGYALGQGQSAAQAQQAIGQVVEGRLAVREIMNLAHKLGIDMPISAQVEEVLLGRCTPEQAVSHLLSREPRQEG